MLRRGCVFFERMRTLNGNQVIRGFIEFHLVETKQFVSSNVNVILMRQICGQRSRMAAGSKRQALALSVPYDHCNNCNTLQHNNNTLQHNNNTLQHTATQCNTLRHNESKRQALALSVPYDHCNNCLISKDICFASTEVVHRPRLDSTLHFDLKNQCVAVIAMVSVLQLQ